MGSVRGRALHYFPRFVPPNFAEDDDPNIEAARLIENFMMVGMKENSPELQFRERFPLGTRVNPGGSSVLADEAVERA